MQIFNQSFDRFIVSSLCCVALVENTPPRVTAVAKGWPCSAAKTGASDESLLWSPGSCILYSGNLGHAAPPSELSFCN